MKYLELVKGLFTADHEARAKQADPYVAYSKEANRLMLNLIPEPADGPADNEIWYTSSDGNVVTPNKVDAFGANIVSNTYENGKGVIKFDNSVKSIEGSAFSRCTSLTSVTIPNSVTWIGDKAFQGCTSLKSITIPNSVTSIGESAFDGCSSLTSITIPESVTTVGGGMFCGCRKLKSVVLPNKITSIPHHTESKAYYGFFGGCISLTSVTIPNSVTIIGEDAFFNCRSLTSISFEGTIEEWNNVTKSSYWNNTVPATHVQCSDGQVAILPYFH